MQKDILIYDIECATYGNSVRDTHLHKLKFFGAYSYKTNQYYFLDSKKEIRQLISKHRILIGFNNKYYDNPILEQEGISLQYKIIIDLLKVTKNRAGLIPFKKSFLSYILKSYSLDSVTKELNLHDKGAKGKLDYTMLNNDEFTKEQFEELKIYTIQDIRLTKKLFEWMYNMFDGWKHHLTEKDQLNLVHMSCAPSVYAYKVLANRVGFREEYRNIKERTHQGAGGYVAYPAIEKLEGDIYCMDFASIYPHAMIQCNLYGRNKNNIGWNGNKKFEMNGYYNADKMDIVGQVLMDIYKERKELKKEKDSREYGLKIVLNTCYGLLRNPIFKNVYDNVAGEDCCLISQQWIKLAMQKYKDAGYFVFYGDTDSVYLQDKFHDKEKVLRIKDEIIKEIKDNVIFPQDTFDMDIDYEIDMIHFFKGGNKKDEEELTKDDIQNMKLGLMKKNYLFIYKDGDDKKLFIKNLGIVKRNNTELSKKIFWDKMVPHILKTHDCKFDSEQIKDWINDYLKKDITLIAKRIQVQPKNHYKSKGCIQMQAYNYIPQGQNENLGSGIFYFIPNKKIGFGKSMKKHCTIEEFKEHCDINQIYTQDVMRELKYFNIKYIEEKISSRKKKIKLLKDIMLQKELW